MFWSICGVLQLHNLAQISCQAAYRRLQQEDTDNPEQLRQMVAWAQSSLIFDTRGEGNQDQF